MLSLAADPRRDTATIPDVSARTVRNAARLLTYLKSHVRRIHEARKIQRTGRKGTTTPGPSSSGSCDTTPSPSRAAI